MEQVSTKKVPAIVGAHWNNELSVSLALLAREGNGLFIRTEDQAYDLMDIEELYNMELNEGELVELIYTPSLANSEIVKELIRLLECPLRLAG